MPIHQYHILTVGGISLWSEACAGHHIEKEYLIPNGIYLVQQPCIKDNIAFCEVDVHKTNMKDFYTWNEIEDKDMFCWRTFYTFGSKESNWLPISKEKYLGPYPCQELFDMIHTIVDI